MARKFIAQVIPEPLPVTFAQETAHHLRTQARDALAGGMGITEFFKWSVDYAMNKRSHSYAEAEMLVIATWTEAYDEHRDMELAA